jgi:carbamoyl-phosphate synthase large subunit
MRSTGEVMGIDADFGRAFAKAEDAAGARLPRTGAVFISMQDRDKDAIIGPAKRLSDLGFDIYATVGTAKALEDHGVSATAVAKIDEGKPDVVDLVYDGKIDLVLNTQTTSVLRHHRPLDRGRYRADGYQIRTAAVLHGVPCITTLSGAVTAVQGIEARASGPLLVRSLQEHHEVLGLTRGSTP